MRSSVCTKKGALVLLVGLVMLLLLPPFFYRNQDVTGKKYIDKEKTVSSGSKLRTPTLERSEALRQHVREACKTLQFPEVKKLSANTLSHLIYDDKHKAIYCYIPKVACTSWKRVFLTTTGRLPEGHNTTSLTRGKVHTLPLPLLKSAKKRDEKLKTYKKFMFVRPPFERVLSAYRDKFERGDEKYDFRKHVGVKIEKKYRGTTAAKGFNVTFREFIRYITEPGPATAERRNHHWLPMHEVCSPCAVDYDFIGTKENLEEDGNHVLGWLGMTELVDTFPASSKPVNASQHVREYLAQLNQTEILAFYTKYLPDYALFDYKLL